MEIVRQGKINARKKRVSILYAYPLTALFAALCVLVFALFYKGGGAEALLGKESLKEELEIAVAPKEAAKQVQAESLKPNSSGRLFPFISGGLWGYKNAALQEVISPAFLYAHEFYDGQTAFAAVEKEGELCYGLINRSGEWVAPPVWSNARPFSEGLAAVEFGGK